MVVPRVRWVLTMPPDPRVGEGTPSYPGKKFHFTTVYPAATTRACNAHQPHAHARALLGASFDQPGTSSFFEAVSGRSHSETWAGCIVSRTTVTRSSLKASRSVSSLSLAEKAWSVFAASYLLR
jgi:hypothetical protein